MARNKIQSAKKKKMINNTIVHIILAVLAAIWLFPILWVIMTSFRAEKGSYVSTFFPKAFTLDNYTKLFTDTSILNFPQMFMNTLFIAICSCILSAFYVLAVSYCLSRMKFKLRKPYMNMAMILGLFPGFMSMIAVYFILKAMGLIEGNLIKLALILCYSGGAGLGFQIAKGFFDTIPIAIDEAALLDGCTRWQIFSRITLPLSKPIIVYTVLTAFMSPWLDFIFAKVICRANSDQYTIAIGLWKMLEKEYIDSWYTSFAAGAVLISIPIAILFLFMQRCYVDGVSGAVKGQDRFMRERIELKNYYSSKEFLDNYIYDGNDLGVECTKEGTIFRLWSPQAECVDLNLYHTGNGEDAYQHIHMKKEEKGVWSYDTKEELHGVYYDYTIIRDGIETVSADPYAKACGVNGKRSMAVNLGKTDPEGWEQDEAPSEKQERIVYELHVKEFSWDRSGGFPEEFRGKYKAFTCKHTTLNNNGIHPTGLDYLKELGVTHIQIMPMYDYGSVDEAGEDTEFNWGYDPVNYNVPEGSYSTDAAHGEVRIREVKEMIKSIHEAGFGVIMDVVYNHTYSLDSWFQRTVPWYFYRVFPDGTVSNGSACGNDVASERKMCAKYILESVLYWTEEYHIDGFRFDLMGLLDVELMNQIRHELDMRYGKGKKIIYGEPWSADKTAIEGGKKLASKENIGLLDENIGVFCDSTRDGIKGSALRAKEAGFINGAQDKESEILAGVTAWCENPYDAQGMSGVKAPSQIITYVSAHDNHTLWDKLKETVSDGDRMRLNKMAAQVYMTCQGTLFFLSGEEFARTKDGQDNTFKAPVSLNRFDWEKAWENSELVNYYKGLIALRKQLPGLCDKSADAFKRITEMWKEKAIVGFTVLNDKDSEWQQVKVVYNASDRGWDYKLSDENWKILCDTDDSWCWKKNIPAGDLVKVLPHSVLILGKSS